MNTLTPTKRLEIRDKFHWQMPQNVSIQYHEKNKNFGTVSVNKKSSLCHLKQLRYIGGVDMSATKPGAYEYDKACAGLVIYEYPSMRLVHTETEIITLKHPYIAGFLAFREVNPLIKLINNIKQKKAKITPDVILVDGNGILHYRRLGLATHLSMEVNIPCVGVAKKLLAIDNLNVNHLVPHLNKKLNKIGMLWKIHGFNGEAVGYALRTHEYDEIVFVSPGNLIGFESSLKIVMLCLDEQRRYKCPIPTEKADFVTRKQIYRYQRNQQNPYAYEGISIKQAGNKNKKLKKSNRYDSDEKKYNANETAKNVSKNKSEQKRILWSAKVKHDYDNKTKVVNSNCVNANRKRMVASSENMSKAAKRRNRRKNKSQAVVQEPKRSKAARRKLRRKLARNS